MHSADWATKIVFLVLLLALSVRLLGITYGLPHVFFPDEAVLVNHAMAFGTGDLNPHSFIYPSLYMYVLFSIYGITYVGGRLSGVFGSTDDFIRLFFTDATVFYLPGRLIAALSGVASVWMVYNLGRRAYNSQVGLIAAAILAFSVLHVNYSHFVKTHVPAGLLVIITVGLAWTIYDGRNSWRRYCLAGATAGLAASTVYHAGFVLIAVFTAHWLCWRKHTDGRLLDPKLLGAAAASLAAFVLTTPFAVLDWPTFLSDLTATGAVYHAGGVLERGIFYPFTSLLSTFGQPFRGRSPARVGLCTAPAPPGRSDRSEPADISGPLPDAVSSQRVHAHASRLSGYFLTGCLVRGGRSKVALFQTRCFRDAGSNHRHWIVGYRTISHVVQSSYRLSLPDTRLLAKAWVVENIPPGSRILMDSGKYYSENFGPPLPLSRWTLEQFIHRGRAANSGNIARRETGRAAWRTPGRPVVFFSTSSTS